MTISIPSDGANMTVSWGTGVTSTDLQIIGAAYGRARVTSTVRGFGEPRYDAAVAVGGSGLPGLR